MFSNPLSNFDLSEVKLVFMSDYYFRAVIFDLGGVILRTEDPAPRAALAQRLGISRSELERIVFENPVSQLAERGLATPADAQEAIADLLNRPVAEIPALLKQFFAGDRVDFALIELIQKLRPAYKTALLSNTWNVDLPAFLREELQIPDTFDVIISSSQQQLVKPDPTIFRLALRLLDARPEEAVFVDDFDRNIAAAAAMGIRTIHFRNAEQARAELLAILGVTGDL